MPDLRPHSGPTDSETLKVGSAICFQQAIQSILMHAKSESNWTEAARQPSNLSSQEDMSFGLN